MMKGSPSISVVIVNYKGLKWLEACLGSLMGQNYDNFEIILVDNNSRDGSVPFVKNHFPNVKLIKNTSNTGFAEGNNIGCRSAVGDYIMLVNNDTFMHKSFLSDLVLAYKEIKNLGCVQPKLIKMDDPRRIDSCGSYWTTSTFLYHYGNDKPVANKNYYTAQPIFSAKGAAIMLSREAVENVGLFDVDFWCYYEETDLCHRLWLAGYECWYWPQAVAFHAGGGTSLSFPDSTIQFHNFKNKLLSFQKNFQLSTLLYVLPVHGIMCTMICLAWFLKGRPKLAMAIPKSLFWNISNIRDTLSKRQVIQYTRRLSDKQIAHMTTRRVNFRYYYFLFINHLERFADETAYLPK